MASIKLLYLPIGKESQVLQIINDLKTFQGLVNGHIGGYPFELMGRKYHAIIDNDGKLKGVQFNRFILREPIAGPFIASKLSADGSENVSLDDFDIDLLRSYFDQQLGFWAEKARKFGRWGLDLK